MDLSLGRSLGRGRLQMPEHRQGHTTTARRQVPRLSSEQPATRFWMEFSCRCSLQMNTSFCPVRESYASRPLRTTGCAQLGTTNSRAEHGAFTDCQRARRCVIMTAMAQTTASAKGELLQAAEFERNLDRLAEVAVRVGLGLAPGQEMVMTATLEAVPLARRITEHAYKAGAWLVTPLFTDEEMALLRFRHAAPESFDTAASWLYEGMAEAYRSGAARLAITSERSVATVERGSGEGGPGESGDVEGVPAGAGADHAARRSTGRS